MKKFVTILRIRIKATGFWSLRVNCWEINELTWKWQMIFLKKFPEKGLKEKSEHYHQILSIWKSLGTKFKLKVTILDFWTNLSQKGYFQSKRESNENHYWILHIRISLSSIFQLQQFWFFGINFQKRILPIKSRKNEHHHWVVHIRITLSTKF